MITELTKAVLDKHGPFTLSTEEMDGRIGIKKVYEKNTEYRYFSFSLVNCLIRLLAEDIKL